MPDDFASSLLQICLQASSFRRSVSEIVAPGGESLGHRVPRPGGCNLLEEIHRGGRCQSGDLPLGRVQKCCFEADRDTAYRKPRRRLAAKNSLKDAPPEMDVASVRLPVRQSVPIKAQGVVRSEAFFSCIDSRNSLRGPMGKW